MKVQRAIRQSARSDRVIARTGSDELGLDPMGLNETDSFLKLKPRSEWRVNDKDWLVEEIRKVMEDLPGIQPTFTQPIEMRISEMLTGRAGIWRSSCSGLTSPSRASPGRSSNASRPSPAPARR
jgi:cobalt-zinc-cadmium resistance protein CzcA